ncbi:hypothetical protein [Streptomyces sp. NPDC008141]|uniref:hypothetical protein n=1 Tax=Streptomyces sp. NPDC008141 TaxID=3364815 RepID=UPI0036E4BAE8
MAEFAMPAATSSNQPERRLIASGTIRRINGRTIDVRATQAGVTGRITPVAVTR